MKVHFTAIVCCGKNRVCGIYLIIQHAANVVFAIILIVFTSRFIKDPCFCYGELCFIPPWEEWNTSGSSPLGGSGCTPRTWDKVPVLKGLLACAILILVTSILFILAYLIALITGRAGRRSDTHTQAITYQSQPAIVQIGAPPMQQYPYVAYPGQQQSYHGQYKSERNNYEQVTEIFWSSFPPINKWLKRSFISASLHRYV